LPHERDTPPKWTLQSQSPGLAEHVHGDKEARVPDDVTVARKVLFPPPSSFHLTSLVVGFCDPVSGLVYTTSSIEKLVCVEASSTCFVLLSGLRYATVSESLAVLSKDVARNSGVILMDPSVQQLELLPVALHYCFDGLTDTLYQISRMNLLLLHMGHSWIFQNDNAPEHKTKMTEVEVVTAEKSLKPAWLLDQSLQPRFRGLQSRHIILLQEATAIREYYCQEGLFLVSNNVEMEKLKAELDEARLSEKQLHQKLDHQIIVVANKSEELRLMSERAHETMSSEMITVQLELHELENAKANLQEELNELQYKNEQLILANENLSRQVERLQVEKEEREKKAVNCFSALEKAHEEKRELHVRLEQALQQAQDPNSKGNSLFAEVEDRRAEMERQLISMKVQYQSLQQQHAFSRQQMHRMKVQNITLLQLKGSHLDPDQMERLQSMVEQKNSEIEKLLVKLRHLEKNQQQNCENTANLNTHAFLQNDDVYYVDLLKMKLEQSSKEMEKLKDELSLQRMKALAESQRVLELERKLFTNDRHLKLSRNENLKLRLNLDELKMKYEPDEVIKLQTQKRRREQLPTDDLPEATASVNCHLTSTADLQPITNQETENAALSMQIDTCTIEESPYVNQNASSESKSPGKSTTIPQERKRVRIIEDIKGAQAVSEGDETISKARSAFEESRIEPTKAEEKDFSKCERKSRRTAPPILHVPSKPGTVSECSPQ
ncbi:PREDICTED: protein Spindly, partial [Nanorana parkeri]|uniref:protein Spindly n=1 Tax=Nanorana parkeri TaxID=125878 RepID=UPI0008549B0B